jgi:hypothetical protein
MESLSGKWRIAIFSYLLVWFIGSFWAIAVLRSGHAEGTVLGVKLSLLREYMYYGFAGSIGGSLYGLRLFHEHYERLTIRWVYWYFMRPFLCVGCAIMTIILFKSGILLLQVGDSPLAKISIAFLTGFGYGKFMEKIKVLTETFFFGSSANSSGNGIPGSGSGLGPGSGKMDDKK